MDAQFWLSLLVNWLPFFVLVLVWIALSRWAVSKGLPWSRLVDRQEAQLAELRRTNELLDRIAVALERRGER